MNSIKYIFNTKFAVDMDKNGEPVEIVKNYHNGKLLIRFINLNTMLEVYDNEIKEEL